MKTKFYIFWTVGLCLTANVVSSHACCKESSSFCERRTKVDWCSASCSVFKKPCQNNCNEPRYNDNTDQMWTNSQNFSRKRFYNKEHTCYCSLLVEPCLLCPQALPLLRSECIWTNASDDFTSGWKKHVFKRDFNKFSSRKKTGETYSEEQLSAFGKDESSFKVLCLFCVFTLCLFLIFGALLSFLLKRDSFLTILKLSKDSQLIQTGECSDMSKKRKPRFFRVPKRSVNYRINKVYLNKNDSLITLPEKSGIKQQEDVCSSRLTQSPTPVSENEALSDFSTSNARVKQYQVTIGNSRNVHTLTTGRNLSFNNKDTGCLQNEEYRQCLQNKANNEDVISLKDYSFCSVKARVLQLSKKKFNDLDTELFETDYSTETTVKKTLYEDMRDLGLSDDANNNQSVDNLKLPDPVISELDETVPKAWNRVKDKYKLPSRSFSSCYPFNTGSSVYYLTQKLTSDLTTASNYSTKLPDKLKDDYGLERKVTSEEFGVTKHSMKNDIAGIEENEKIGEPDERDSFTPTTKQNLDVHDKLIRVDPDLENQLCHDQREENNDQINIFSSECLPKALAENPVENNRVTESLDAPSRADSGNETIESDFEKNTSENTDMNDVSEALQLNHSEGNNTGPVGPKSYENDSCYDRESYEYVHRNDSVLLKDDINSGSDDVRNSVSMQIDAQNAESLEDKSDISCEKITSMGGEEKHHLTSVEIPIGVTFPLSDGDYDGNNPLSQVTMEPTSKEGKSLRTGRKSDSKREKKSKRRKRRKSLPRMTHHSAQSFSSLKLDKEVRRYSSYGSQSCSITVMSVVSEHSHSFLRGTASLSSYNEKNSKSLQKLARRNELKVKLSRHHKNKQSSENTSQKRDTKILDIEMEAHIDSSVNLSSSCSVSSRRNDSLKDKHGFEGILVLCQDSGFVSWEVNETTKKSPAKLLIECFIRERTFRKPSSYFNSHLKVLRKFFDEEEKRLLAKSVARELYIEHRDFTSFGLDSYFDRLQNGPPPTEHDRMLYEWFRLVSFHNYTGNGNALALARNGFYHDQARGSTFTRCYLCEASNSSWEMFDDISAEHRRQSPNCPFHENRGEESINIPIASSDNGLPVPQNRTSSQNSAARSENLVSTASFVRQSGSSEHSSDSSEGARNVAGELERTDINPAQTSACDGESRPQQPTDDPESKDQLVLVLPQKHQLKAIGRSGHTYSTVIAPRHNNVAKGAQSNAGLETITSGSATLSKPSQLQSTQSSSILGGPIGAGAFHAQQTDAKAPVSTATEALQGNSAVSTASTRAASAGQTTEGRINEGSGLAASQGTQGPGAGGRGIPPSSIVIENPRHPDNQDIDRRIETFQGWPPHLDQTPRQMAEAGFFFVGVADFTRCFCCGGGLRNWEPGDDPVLEHTRWFPRCQYINKLKGERYVAAVQRRHEEHMAEQQRRENEQSRRRDENQDPMATDAAEVLLQMGFSADRILVAILAVRQQTGSLTVTTQQVLTWLLDEEDRQTSPETEALGVRPPGSTASATPSSIANTGTSAASSTVNTGASSTTSGIKTTSSQSTVSAGTTTSTSPAPTVTTASSQQTGTSASTASTSATGDRQTEGRQTGSPAGNFSTKSGEGSAGKQSGGDSDESKSSATGDTSKTTKKKTGKKKSKTKSGTKSETSGATGGDTDAKSLKAENEKLREMQTCKICMEQPVNTTLLPCGHLVCCESCAARLQRCPICRKRIKGTVKTFMS